jgi:hypothetical protein
MYSVALASIGFGPFIGKTFGIYVLYILIEKRFFTAP